MEDELRSALGAAARHAAAQAHAPYSGFAVGAALLGRSGRIHVGCNVENASFGLTICAERAAVSRAVAEGEREFEAVFVVGGPADGSAPAGECVPCGACLQVLAEFCGDDLAVLTADYEGRVRERRLGELLPESFRLRAPARPPRRPPDPPGAPPAAASLPPPRPPSAAPGGASRPAPAGPRPPASPPPAPMDAGGGVRAWAASLRDAALVLVALARGEAGRAARATWVPAAAAALAAASAGALAGAAVPAPPDNPLASTAAAAALAAPVAIGLAAVMVWVRTAAAARASAVAWHGLRVRGAGALQLWGLVGLTVLPRAVAAVVCGAGSALLGTVAVSMASFYAGGGHTSGQIFAGACAWAGATAVLLALVAVVAALGPALRPPSHFRTAGAGGPGLARQWPDAVLIVVAATLALAARSFVAASPSAAAAAFGPAAGAAAGAARFWLLPGVDAAGALAVLGAALLAGRALSAGLGAIERGWGAALSPVWLLVVRATARGTTRLRLALLPALAVAALAFCVAGPLGVAATDRGLQASLAGADLRVDAQWNSPCQASLTIQAAAAGISACCAQVAAPLSPATGAAAVPGSGAPGPSPSASGSAPVSGSAPQTVCVPFTAVPLPNFAPIGNLAAAGAPASTLALVPDLWHGASGQIALQDVGVDPPSLLSAALWRGFPGAAAARAALSDLAAGGGGGAVISATLAAETGLAPGDRLSTRILPDVRVAAVVPAWPGVGAAESAWAVVPQSILLPAVQAAKTYALGGLRTELLIGAPLSSGASPSARSAAASTAAATLEKYGAQVTATLTPRAGGWGLGWLPVAVGPVLAALLLLLLPALRTSDLDPAAFPVGLALSAIAAEPEARTARRRFGMLVASFGAAWGLAAGTAAAALFWPAVRIQPTGVAHVAFRPSWTPLWAAAAVAAVGLAAVAIAALRPSRVAADALVAARVAEAAARTPEPPARDVPVPAPRPARRPPVPGQGGLLRTPGLAFAILAARRLGASWPRLLGLGAGILLAAAVAATVPLYTTGSLTRVLQEGLQPVNQRPAGAVLVDDQPRTGGGVTAADLQRVQAVAATAGPAAGLASTPVVSYLATTPMGETQATPAGQPGAQSGYLALDAIAGFAGHVTLERGVMPATAPEPDGTIEAAASDLTMTANGLTLGDVYLLQTPTGGTLRVKLVGVFAEADPQGDFWPFKYFHQDLFIGYGQLQGLLTGIDPLPLDDASWYQVLDLRTLDVQTVPPTLAALERFQVRLGDALPGATVDVSPLANLSAFTAREQTLTALLRLVAVPVLAMALYFVALTAGLIVDAEAGEISVYTSRGANAAHIILLYLVEWVLLAIPLAALAPFPAAAFARAMGAASGFLHFVPRPPLPIFVERRDFEYAAVAAGLAVAAALLPTIGAMGRSVVAARLRASRTVEQPLWQRAYLDAAALAALGVAWWIFRNVSLGSGGASAIVADPALYLLPAIFLAVSGLLAVRFLGWLLRNLDAAFGPWLRPAAVLPLRRIGRLPAQFAPVLLLLCFTAALGTYSAAAARTLDGNLVAAVQYADGAPLRLVEDSPCSQMQAIAQTVCQQYDDVLPVLTAGATRPLPAFSDNLQAKGVAAASELDVLPANFTGGGLLQVPANLVLVDPASFERVAWWNAAWNPDPESHYLDLLQSAPDAMLVSPDIARLTHASTLQVSLQTGSGAAFAVAGTVGYWPGADAADPMLVADAASATRLLHIDCGADPCITSRIALIQPQPGVDPTTIAPELAAYGIAVTQQDVAATEEATALGTPEWAGQSGLLTIGFLVALAVTIVGYLLYASLVLRGQLSQLGLLRALGLDWRSVVGTVALEQGILVIAGAVAGALAGMIASLLFLPLFRPAFTGSSAPPFAPHGPGGALLQVAAVLCLLFGVVLATLLALLRRMHVGETVKLEE